MAKRSKKGGGKEAEPRPEAGHADGLRNRLLELAKITVEDPAAEEAWKVTNADIINEPQVLDLLRKREARRQELAAAGAPEAAPAVAAAPPETRPVPAVAVATPPAEAAPVAPAVAGTVPVAPAAGERRREGERGGAPAGPGARETEAQRREVAIEAVRQALSSGNPADIRAKWAQASEQGVDLLRLNFDEEVRAGFERNLAAEAIDQAKALWQFLEEVMAVTERVTLRNALETRRNQLLEKGRDSAGEAARLETFAREAGVDLRPPPAGLIRPEEIERRARDLRGKVRAAEAERLIDPAQIKERYGREAREGIFGDIMERLLTDQELLSVRNTRERERERAVIEVMTRTFEQDFGFSREQCENIYHAIKSWLLQRAQQEEQSRGFFGRLLRPRTTVGRVFKGLGYLATGVGSTLLTGPLGLLITGGLRQLDLVGNRALDEKLANRFRARMRGDKGFLDGLETHLSELVSAEVRRMLYPDKSTRGMDLDGRTQFYFERVRVRPEIVGEAGLNEAEKIGLAQRLAVQYALDDEAEQRIMAAEARQRQGWQQSGVARWLGRIDGRIAGNNPSERFNTGMAVTGIGLGLAMAARASTWGRRLAAAYGGWKIGGALYEMRGREIKDPVLNTEARLRQAGQTLQELQTATAARNWAHRDLLEGALRRQLSEVKASLGLFPAGGENQVRLEAAQREFQRLQMELVFIEFQKEQDDREAGGTVTIEQKLATAQALARGATRYDLERTQVVERERRGITVGRVASRLIGAAAGLALSEGAVRAFREWQEWRAEQAAKGGRALPPPEAPGTPRPAAAAGAVESAPLVGSEKTAVDPLEQFRVNHGVLAKQEFDIKYEGGKYIVEVQMVRGGQFDHLQQALRRLVVQEYDLRHGQSSFTSLDAGRVENSVANLARLLPEDGHVAGFKHADIASFMSYNPQTGVLHISDYKAFARFADQKVGEHAADIINVRSGALAYTDDTAQVRWQEMLDQKASAPGASQAIADNFNSDPLVTAAEHRIFAAGVPRESLGLTIASFRVIDQDTGWVVLGGEQNGFQVLRDHDKFIGIRAPDSTAVPLPEGAIPVADSVAGAHISEAIGRWQEAQVQPVLEASVPLAPTLEKIETQINAHPAFEGARVLPVDSGGHILRLHFKDQYGDYHNGTIQDGKITILDGKTLASPIAAENAAAPLAELLKPHNLADLLGRKVGQGGIVDNDGDVHFGAVRFKQSWLRDVAGERVDSFIDKHEWGLIVGAKAEAYQALANYLRDHPDRSAISVGDFVFKHPRELLRSGSMTPVEHESVSRSDI